MTGEINGFIHRFVPADDGERVTILALHGTGGNESDLVPLARQVAPGAAILSPRGKVLEHGVVPRFFRRLEEGVFDIDDLVFRAHELAEFVEAAAETYDLDRERIVALGYSNGANIAAAVLLLRPETLAGAILLRPMVPFTPETSPDLNGKNVLISSGLMDPLVPTDEPNRLVTILQAAGAIVNLFWQAAGHGLTQADMQEARKWLAERELVR